MNYKTMPVMQITVSQINFDSIEYTMMRDQHKKTYYWNIPSDYSLVSNLDLNTLERGQSYFIKSYEGREPYMNGTRKCYYWVQAISAEINKPKDNITYSQDDDAPVNSLFDWK